MLARKVFEKYKETQDVLLTTHADRLVRKYIEENNLDNSTSYAEYIGAVHDVAANWWIWQQ